MAICFTHNADAQATYTFSDITLPSGAQITGLNDLGQVTAYTATVANGSVVVTSYIYDISTGASLVIPAYGGGITYEDYNPTSISDAGNIILSSDEGYLYPTANPSLRYNENTGIYSPISSPPGTCQFDVESASNNGYLAGQYSFYTCLDYGFVYDPSTQKYTTIYGPNPNPNSSNVLAINDKGTALVFVQPTTSAYLFYLYGVGTQKYKPLDSGNYYSNLNDSNFLVGVGQSANGQGFIFDENTHLYTTLSNLNGTKTTPVAVNNQNVVVGQYTVGTATHYFVATPQAGAMPTVLELAALSEDVYNGNYAPVGYRYLGDNNSAGTPSSCNSSSVRVASYASTDGTQLIFAIRGTVIDLSGQSFTSLKNLAADVSFNNKNPNTILSSSVQKSACYVSSVISTLQPKLQNVTLTGHSFGGALAEFLGQASGLTTRVFDAPGGAALYSDLQTQLAPVASYHAGGTDIGYRIFGDQYSLFGQHYANATLTTLANTYPSSAIVANPLEFVAKSHDIELVVSQIASGAPATALGPKITKQLVDEAVKIVSKGPLLFKITLDATYGALQIIDPGYAADFVLTNEAGSPLMTCIDLPLVDGVSSWSVSARAPNGTWSPAASISGGGSSCFGTASKAVAFMPTDSTGQNIELPDSLYFGITYASSGKVVATLQESTTVTTATHPRMPINPTFIPQHKK